jgi:hypothetical protein
MAAANNGDGTPVRLLFAYGADPAVKDTRGPTAVAYASSPDMRVLLTSGSVP